MPTFGDLVANLQDHFNVGTPAAPRMLRELLEWHRRLLSGPGSDLFRLISLTTSASAGSTPIRLPIPFARIDKIQNLTHNIPLQEKSLDWWKNLPPTVYTSGTPFAYVVLGFTPTDSDPALPVGAQLQVLSSAVGDTTQKVTIVVLRAGGNQARATVTLNGTTAVNIGPLDAKQILSFQLQTAATGIVTIQDATPNLYGTIAIGDLDSNRYRLALVPYPSSTVSLQIDGQRHIDQALTTTDEPWIPAEWCYLLEMGARCLEYEKQDDARLAATRQDLEREIRRFRFWCEDRPDVKMIPGQVGVQTGSNLGPWFPKGRW
jgi:hypothetical protein